MHRRSNDHPPPGTGGRTSAGLARQFFLNQPDCEKGILSTFASGTGVEVVVRSARVSGGIPGGACAALSSFCQALLTCRMVSICVSSNVADWVTDASIMV